MRLLRRIPAWVVLIALFAREFMFSVRDVLVAVIHPQRIERSGIVAVPLDLRTDAGIALLANMITLTPGTTSLHVSDDRSRLYVHVMNLSEDAVDQIKSGFERRVREALE
ncbi:MAG: Na+/H+ antiporter subunit E [Pseudomonadota bacterium]|nr:Na+/H+ antiporter subunit E [Pseudomonadota bacterium]